MPHSDNPRSVMSKMEHERHARSSIPIQNLGWDGSSQIAGSPKLALCELKGGGCQASVPIQELTFISN